MQIIGAVLVFFFAVVTTASAQSACNCTVTVGPPIVFSDDPLIFENEVDVTYHTEIYREVKYLDGECFVPVEYLDGVTKAYQGIDGYLFHRITFSPPMSPSADPALRLFSVDLTLDEVLGLVSDICPPSEEPMK